MKNSSVLIKDFNLLEAQDLLIFMILLPTTGRWVFKELRSFRCFVLGLCRALVGARGRDWQGPCLTRVNMKLKPGDLSCLPCALLFGRSRVYFRNPSGWICIILALIHRFLCSIFSVMHL